MLARTIVIEPTIDNNRFPLHLDADPSEDLKATTPGKSTLLYHTEVYLANTEQ